MLPLILASSSIPRQELLSRLQIPFSTCSPDIDETALPEETPEALVIRLAVSKARAVAKRFPAALIIGCDQVATYAGKAFSKPESTEDAVAQLTLVSGQRVRYFNGLCLYNSQTDETQQILNHFDVIYRPLTEKMIVNYLERDRPFNCAGSLRSEGLGIALLDHMEGSDPTSLIGLPLISLVRLLENAGIEVV